MLAISVPCQKKMSIMFYLCDTPVCDVYWVNRFETESANLSTSSVLFLLSFTDLANLLHQITVDLPVMCSVGRETHVGRDTSHTRLIQVQCAYVLPTVLLKRESFPDAIYLINTVFFNYFL